MPACQEGQAFTHADPPLHRHTQLSGAASSTLGEQLGPAATCLCPAEGAQGPTGMLLWTVAMWGKFIST